MVLKKIQLQEHKLYEKWMQTEVTRKDQSKLWDKLSRWNVYLKKIALAAVGFEPTPFRTGALNQRLRPLGHATLR